MRVQRQEQTEVGRVLRCDALGIAPQGQASVVLRAADPEHFTNEQRWLFAELYGAQRFWTEQERARVVGAWMAMKGTP